MAFAQVVNFGKGFITHTDQTLLAFSGGVDNIWEVTGSPQDVSDWIARVGAIAKTSQEAAIITTDFTNFLYTRLEFFTELVTPTQVATLFSLAVSDTDIRPFVKQILTAENMDVRDNWFIEGTDLLLLKGHINQTKHDEMLAGR